MLKEIYILYTDKKNNNHLQWRKVYLKKKKSAVMHTFLQYLCLIKLFCHNKLWLNEINIYFHNRTLKPKNKEFINVFQKINFLFN